MDYRILFKYKIDYLKLALKISRLRFKGDIPPSELLQQAHEIGRLAGISEQELKNLWGISCDNCPPYCTVHRHDIFCVGGFMDARLIQSRWHPLRLRQPSRASFIACVISCGGLVGSGCAPIPGRCCPLMKCWSKNCKFQPMKLQTVKSAWCQRILCVNY